MAYTQQQIDSLLSTFKQHYSGSRADYYGYRGECLSLAKRWLDWLNNGGAIYPMRAPASPNGKGSGYWSYPPALVQQYFVKETYSPLKNYPAGSMVVYTNTSHIAVLLANGTTASVFEQNADPDGSATGTHQRPSSRINGVLVIKTVAPAPVNTGKYAVGDTVWLHPASNSWKVYKKGSQPVSDNAIGILKPRSYNHGPNGKMGLTYKIIGVSKYANTYTIHTDSYGDVDIYLDNEASKV